MSEEARKGYADAQPEARIVGELDPEQNTETRGRQAARSQVTGIILISLCILFFAITVVKVGVWG